MEEQLPAGLSEGQVAEFVEDEVERIGSEAPADGGVGGAETAIVAGSDRQGRGTRERARRYDEPAGMAEEVRGTVKLLIGAPIRRRLAR